MVPMSCVSIMKSGPVTSFQPGQDLEKEQQAEAIDFIWT